MFFALAVFALSKLSFVDPGYNSFVALENEEIEIDMKGGIHSSMIIFPTNLEKNISIAVETIDGQKKVIEIGSIHAINIRGKTASFILPSQTFLQIWIFNKTLCEGGSTLIKSSYSVSDSFPVPDNNGHCIFFANNAQIKGKMQCSTNGSITTYGAYLRKDVIPDHECKGKNQCRTHGQLPRFAELVNCGTFGVSLKLETHKHDYIKGCSVIDIPTLKNGVYSGPTTIEGSNAKCQYKNDSSAFMITAYVFAACFAVILIVGVVISCISNRNTDPSLEKELLKDSYIKHDEEEINM